MRVPARVVCLTVTTLCLAAPAQASAACANAGARPSGGNLPQIRSAVLCLLNKERSSRGMRKLRANAKLRTAADRHSASMNRKDYFAHVSPSGTTPLQRVQAARYLTGSQAWTVGENIAWGEQRLSTPAQIMKSWMNSPAHRANILNRRFRHVGVGVAVGAPIDGAAGGATYTTAFGKR